ncbi:hypothetical protein K439DRAFT_1408126 [Ramaria rubella]|nr:hypothetical protein K439DRAFT_1408126 [Ramaria rubella]
MSEQGEMLTKLSKSQKKKKAAQKKKLAKKVDKANEEQETTWRAQKMSDEIDARMMEPFNDNAMKTNDFQMLNIRGKLLAHPSQTFLDAFSNLRQSMGRDSYPHRVRHLQRLYQGAGNTPSIAYAVAMGAASYLPLNKPTKRDSGGCAYTDQAHGALGLMVWYPIFSICMGAGDKLTCIALRDTCVLLKTCYGFFRNDITR